MNPVMDKDDKLLVSKELVERPYLQYDDEASYDRVWQDFIRGESI